MPTFVRTRKHSTATQNEPLHKVSEQVEAYNMGGGQQLGGQGQTPRAYEHGATGTSPRQNSKSTDLDKTPPAEAKGELKPVEMANLAVLPWVERVETGTIPDGMFGPYDSEPPSRMPTMHEAGVPEPRARIIHPFAYSATATIPFAAVVNQLDHDEDVPPLPLKDHAGRCRESEVMSRGAGMKSGHHGVATFGAGKLGSSKTEVGGSPDGGTFGMDARSPRKAATSRGTSPVKTPVRPVPTYESPNQPMLPTSQPKSASAYGRKPVPAEPVHTSPNLHRPHHDHPFSHYEAAQKQAAAVEEARAEALARLEAKRGEVQDTVQGGLKGPRGTYDTATSGPSFGHINHLDGHPTSARQSYQIPSAAGIGSVPMSREPASFFRIPFGVPMTASLPRPMLLMRTGTGAGMGLGIGSVGLGSATPGARLEEVPEASEESKRRDDRSAFVETVEDVEDPKTPKLKIRNQSLSSHIGTHPEPTPARTESELNPMRMSHQTYAHHASVVRDPAQYPPEAQQGGQRTQHPTTSRTHASKSPTEKGRSPRLHRPKDFSHYKRSPTDKEATIRGDRDARAPTERTKAPTIASDHRTFGGRAATNDDHPNHHGHQHHPHAAPSIAPTSASSVKRIVKDSSFHDETLCELLEAARLNLIGPEAKKALQRAARARVIELKDIKANSDASAAHVLPPSSGDKRSKSKAKSSHPGTTVPVVHEISGPAVHDDSATPKWAQLLTAQMAELDARFIQLAEQQQYQAGNHKGPATYMSPEAMQDEADTIPQELINDLIFHGLPSSTFTAGGGLPPFFTIDETVIHTTTRDSPQSARIRAMTPSHKAREASGEVTLAWGSEVEMPSGGNSSPPKAHQGMSMAGGPTINVHPPTESNARTRLASIPSRTDPRTPNRTEIDLVEEQFIPGSGMADKSLPDTPEAREDSVRSTVPSPEAGRAATKAGTVGGAGAAADYFSNDQSRQDTMRSEATTPVQHRAPQTAQSYQKARLNVGPTNGHGNAHHTEHSSTTQNAQTAPTHLTARPSAAIKGGKDVIYVTEAVEVMPELGPWDHVTQRLYAWALVWEDESFTKALENLALGRQVEVIPLTVFSMMTYKRLLNRNLMAEPQKSCDKLFVPPIMAEAINKAVHNKQIDNARHILEELWYTWGFKTPPRVIIALAKHRNESEKWTAHRFDLSTGHLTTYGVTSEEQNLPDGRPFMWWHAIRAAWPEYHIPDPEQLKQRVEWVITPWEERNDNSLKALNYARNLLLGFRPELARDLGKLRETVWEEVKRLLHKKRSGHLVVHVDSHENEI